MSLAWPALYRLWSLSDKSDSRLHSLADRRRDIPPRLRPPPAPASLSSQIRGSVGRNLSVGRNCFNVLQIISDEYKYCLLLNIYLFESFQTNLCLWGTWPAALYLSKMATTWPRTVQNSEAETEQYFWSSDTKPIRAGVVSGWSPHWRWNSVHNRARAISQGRNLIIN